MQRERTVNELIRRYFTFIIALFIMAFGRSPTIRANLGSSPSTCPPYALSLIPDSPLTIGEYTMIMHAIFTFIQYLLLKKDFQLIQILQVGVGVAFGWFMDLTMQATAVFHTDVPALRLIILLVGCALIAVGIVIEVKCDVLILAVEGLALAITKKMKGNFGKVKIWTDVFFVLLSIIIMLLSFGYWNWEIVGIGTLIAMFLVGFLVGVFTPYFSWVDTILLNGESTEEKHKVHGKHPLIVTISRQYGAGGRVIGEKLSKQLGIKLVDDEIIDITAEVLGYDEDYIRKTEQSLTSYQFLQKMFTANTVPKSMAYSSDDEIFRSQKKIIKKIADQESCIIIGRCANWVLRHRENCIRVFVYSTLDRAVKRISKASGQDEATLPQKILRVNKARGNHYRQYTSHQWTDSSQYDLMINTTNISTDQAVKAILEFIENKKNNK
ncbi:MAG: cytidylate kinase family protein [Bacteroidales bacterium]|nr:cytidylate kinase family protein [Bacteroidales bacterium]